MRRFLAAFLLALCASAQSGTTTTGEHEVRTADGVQLWYRVAGPQDGIPVVFLHGGPGEGSQAMQALGGPALEQSVRMVYLDQRGSGRSERPDDPRFYSLALLESDVELLRRELGADKIVLLSHSAGTPTALDYAADHPEHVAGLILTGAVPDLPAVVDHLCERIEALLPQYYAKTVAARTPGHKCNPFGTLGDEQQAFFDRNMFPDANVRERVDWLDHIPSLANSGQIGGALFSQGLMDYRFTRPERLTMPLLFIAGGRDFQTPIPPQRLLAAKVRDGQVLVYPDAGHFMFADEPQRFARDVAAFVRRVSQ